jgi:alpha-beta hydrolase superfamily lysophospholipase
MSPQPAALSAQDIQALNWKDLAPAKPESREDITHEDGYTVSADGTKLFWQSWLSPDVPQRGRIALIHGYGEHSARYDHVATILARAGYWVMACDVRGHGRSSGVKAHVNRHDDYLDDVDALIAQVRAHWPKNKTPLFVLGHSNGGLITLRYAVRRPEGIEGFVVTSPMCGFAVEIPAWKSRAGKIMSKLRPTFGMPSGLDPVWLTHDTYVVDVYKKDPLVADIATSRWFTESNWAFEDLHERAAMIKQPLLMLIGGSDHIVDPDASQRIFRRVGSPDAELGVYDDLYHEILNEPEWDEITTRIILWLEAHRVSDQSEEEE